MFALRLRISVSLVFMCCLFVLVPSGYGQDFPLDTDQQFVKEFARPGRATMLINVWGSAGQPGLWRVEKDIDLIDFLSLVGVPGIGERQPRTRTKTYVAIYRSVNGERRQSYREQVEDILEDDARYPDLRNNDIVAIEVEERTRVGLQLFSSIVGTASSLTLLVLRLTGN